MRRLLVLGATLFLFAGIVRYDKPDLFNLFATPPGATTAVSLLTETIVRPQGAVGFALLVDGTFIGDGVSVQLQVPDGLQQDGSATRWVPWTNFAPYLGVYGIPNNQTPQRIIAPRHAAPPADVSFAAVRASIPATPAEFSVVELDATTWNVRLRSIQVRGSPPPEVVFWFQRHSAIGTTAGTVTTFKLGTQTRNLAVAGAAGTRSAALPTVGGNPAYVTLPGATTNVMRLGELVDGLRAQAGEFFVIATSLVNTALDAEITFEATAQEHQVAPLPPAFRLMFVNQDFSSLQTYDESPKGMWIWDSETKR